MECRHTMIPQQWYGSQHTFGPVASQWCLLVWCLQALIGRVLSPVVSLSQVRQVLNQSGVSQRPPAVTPTARVTTVVDDALSPQSPDNPFNSPRATAQPASHGGQLLMSPVALPNHTVASSHRGGLPRCGELLEAMQAYVCEVDHNDSVNTAARKLFSDGVGNLTTAAPVALGSSDVFATSASGRIEEVFSVLNTMRKVCRSPCVVCELQGCKDVHQPVVLRCVVAVVKPLRSSTCLLVRPRSLNVLRAVCR
jgi:hypothetical protein